MSTDVPSYQHGKPYEIDKFSLPKSLGREQKSDFNTSRDTRRTEKTMISNPTTIPHLLQNIKVSLSTAWPT
jgi:hypothetical protein